MNYFYFDLETTGLNPRKDHIIQMAYIIEVDGEVITSNSIRIRPPLGTLIHPIIQKLTDRSIQDIQSGLDPYQLVEQVYSDISGVQGGLYVVGYNVQFDIDFLKKCFTDNGNYKLFNHLGKAIDVLQLVTFDFLHNDIEVENLKLGTICQALNIELSAHDAMSDIEATRELFLRYKKKWLNQ